MNLQEQISRIQSMMWLNESKTYQIYVDMGGVLFPSSSNDEVQRGTTEKPIDVRGFQSWVVNNKKDNQILGKYGVDGKWGKLTSNAWVKYGEEYKRSYPNKMSTNSQNANFIGDTLWNYIKGFNPNILTSIGSTNQEQKRQNKLNQATNILGLTDDKVYFVIKGTDKQNYSGPNKILIDDSPENIDKWVRKGGVGILHRNNNDTIRQLTKYLS
jgi:hypothetical protein